VTRPWTPDRKNSDGSTTMRTKRACNGCSALLGDITDQEMALAINGLPLPDVRKECPACGPTASEPRCLPMKVYGGYPGCLENDCDHDIALDAEYCDQVSAEIVCATHSSIGNDGEITHPEPRPCKHTKAVASRG
jgi:hypothetical protein